MALGDIPKQLRRLYEIHEWRHASAVLIEGFRGGMAGWAEEQFNIAILVDERTEQCMKVNIYQWQQKQ